MSKKLNQSLDPLFYIWGLIAGGGVLAAGLGYISTTIGVILVGVGLIGTFGTIYYLLVKGGQKPSQAFKGIGAILLGAVVIAIVAIIFTTLLNR